MHSGLVLLLFSLPILVCDFEENPFSDPTSYNGEMLVIEADDFRQYLTRATREHPVVFLFTTDNLASCAPCTQAEFYLNFVMSDVKSQLSQIEDAPTVFFATMYIERETYPIARELQMRSLPALFLFKAYDATPYMYEPAHLYNGERLQKKRGGTMNASQLTSFQRVQQGIWKGVDRKVKRQRGGFGERVDDEPFKFDNEAAAALETPMHFKKEEEFYTPTSLEDWLVEVLQLQIEVNESTAPLIPESAEITITSRTVVKNLVILVLCVSFIMYLVQTFMPLHIPFSVFEEAPLSYLIHLLVGFALVLYLLIIGGLYFAILNNTPLVGMQEGRVSIIMPTRGSQYAIEVYIILFLGLGITLSVLRLHWLWSQRPITTQRLTQVATALVILGVSLLGVLFVYMRKSPYYLIGTGLHTYLANLFFGGQLPVRQ